MSTARTTGPAVVGHVRAHYSQDAGQEGWTFGITDTRGTRGATRTWLTVPGSAYGVTLHVTEDAARAAMREEDATLRQIAANLSQPELATKESIYEVRRVRAVWRYGRNWFEIIETADPTLTGTDTPYRFVHRTWKGQDIGGWSVVRADNGRHLGWVCQPVLGDHPKWVRWQARAAEEAFLGDGPDDTGGTLDQVPDWLLGASGRGAVIGEGRNRDEAVFELLIWLDNKRAPAVGHGRHGDVRRWADR